MLPWIATVGSFHIYSLIVHAETMASGTFKHLQALPIAVIVVLSLLFIHHLVVASTISLLNEPASHVDIYHPNYFEVATPGSSIDFMNSHQSEYASMHTINELEPTSSSNRLHMLNLNDDTYTILHSWNVTKFGFHTGSESLHELVKPNGVRTFQSLISLFWNFFFPSSDLIKFEPNSGSLNICSVSLFISSQQKKACSTRVWNFDPTNVSHLLLIILLSGQVETNPGPSNEFPCGICKNEVFEDAKAMLCDNCQFWCHTECVGLSDHCYSQFMNNTSSFSWICYQCGAPNFDSSLFGTRSIELSNPFSSLDDSNGDDPNGSFMGCAYVPHLRLTNPRVCILCVRMNHFKVNLMVSFRGVDSKVLRMTL